MKTIIFAMILLASAQSFADTKMECYQRVYSKTHLRNNPQQDVTYIDLTLVKDGDVIEAHSTLALKNSDYGHSLSTGCEVVGGALSCVDSEAGVNLKITIKNKKTARIEVVKATSWYRSESDMSVTIFPKSVDSVFALNRVSCD